MTSGVPGAAAALGCTCHRTPKKAATSRGTPNPVKLTDEFAYTSKHLRARGVVVGQVFVPGDDLVFQLESGFGLLRVLAVDEVDASTRTWHLLAYEELFPDVESAEAVISNPERLHVRVPHMALTDRAFERTPAARLGNRPITSDELAVYREWQKGDGIVSDRSALLMLGFR